MEWRHLRLSLTAMTQLARLDVTALSTMLESIAGVGLPKRLARNYAEHITASFVVPTRDNDFVSSPADLPISVISELPADRLIQLYSHRAESRAAVEGSTASS